MRFEPIVSTKKPILFRAVSKLRLNPQKKIRVILVSPIYLRNIYIFRNKWHQITTVDNKSGKHLKCDYF